MDQHSNPHFDEDLDCEGLLCPLPVLRARKRLLAMESGAVLRVRTTDRMALIDLPHFCAGAGHDYLDAQSEGAVTLHRIRRGPGLSAASDTDQISGTS